MSVIPASAKLMGIYCQEERSCGCTVKHYFGGKTVINGCSKHKTSVFYKCNKCGQEFGKRKGLLKEHQWEHAV